MASAELARLRGSGSLAAPVLLLLTRLAFTWWSVQPEELGGVGGNHVPTRTHSAVNFLKSSSLGFPP